ncbi:MAG TPA: hypothetical protein VG146_04815 [Verrucomicrobiae bacterium]|nr:hypothetical protein [Verrucomicrobiae bacterium]
MTFLPIVRRELRATARRRATYWMRLAIALLATCVGAGTFIVTLGSVTLQQTGQFIFRGLSGLLLLYGLAYGRRATADCLSSEKREGTLGLLFLTDLKGHDVVLGKLTATSLNDFYGLLAALPVLAVCLLLGGITSGEFWRMVLVLVDTFLLSLSIGMLGSALTRQFRWAMAANFLLLLLITGALPACALAIAYSLPAIGLLPQLLWCCPAYGFYLSFDAPYKFDRANYWCSVALIQAMAWLLIVLASSIVPRSWQDRPAQSGQKRWRELWQAWSYGKEAQRPQYRRRLLDRNAFYWLAARARLKPAHVWVFLACMAVWWLVGWAASGHFWFDEAEYILSAALLSFGLKVWITTEAGQEIADDQRSGAVELLLSVPLSVEDILRGQLLALRRQFLSPLLVVIGVELIFMAALYRRSHEARILAMWLAAPVMLVMDVVTLAWVAMARALTAKNHNHATISALLRVLALPWVLFGLVLGLGNAWYTLTQYRYWAPGWKFDLALWFALGLGADLLFGLRAWWQLHHHFRELALQRFSPAAAPVAAEARPEIAHPVAQPQPDGLQLGRLEGSGTACVRPGKRWAWMAICLATGCVAVLVLSSRSNVPRPLSVTLGPHKGPMRVLAMTQGVMFILPDGSLWRWGIPGTAWPTPAPFPEQVGTNRNWMQVSAAGGRYLGLQDNGTIWQWHSSAYTWGEGPAQAGSGNDWMSVGALHDYTVAVRSNGTLWARGGAPFEGAQLTGTNLVQVGTNDDWKAIGAHWSCMFGLRKDGSLWVWGRPFFFGTGTMAVNTYAKPTRVCREMDWTAFNGGLLLQAWTRSGELWDLSYGPPEPEGHASASCRLVLTNSRPGKAAVAFPGMPKLYHIHADGTLWERDYSYETTSPPKGQWRRVGERSDWTSVWGGGGTALGLTADGTLWTWGFDAWRQAAPDFWSKLRIARVRLSGWIGGQAGRVPGPGMPGFQDTPRPLMKLAPP